MYGHLKRLEEGQAQIEEAENSGDNDNDSEEEGGTIGGLFKVIKKVKITFCELNFRDML